MDTTITQKLRYRIFECSSEDAHHPVSELLTGSPQSTGWQSQRFCSFPQYITFQFMSPIMLKQIQFLSHENKISSKIELFTAIVDSKQPLPSTELKFNKLGFLCLDTNESSSYQLRELKTVYVEAPCLYLRIAFHKCHVNKHNFFNQVGLIAIAAYGEPLSNNNAPQRSLTQSLERKDRMETPSPINAAVNGVAAKKIKELEELKLRAAEAEEFEEAQRLKNEIIKLKNVSQQIQKFEEKRTIAVQNEDYETADLVQKELEKLNEALTQLTVGGRHARKLKTLNSTDQKQKGSLLEIPDARPSRQRLSVKEGKQRNHSQQKSEGGEYMEEMKMDQGDDHFTHSADDYENVRQVGRRMAHDDQVIPAMVKKNHEILEEHPSQNNLPQEAEELSKPHQKLAEPLAPIVGAEMCKKIFSKHWNLREEALKTLIDELPKESRSDVINYSDAAQAYVALVGVVSYTIGDRLNQISARSMTLFKGLLGKKAPVTMKSELSNYIEAIMGALLDKISDSNNPRNRDQAEDVILTMAKNPLVTCSYCVNALARKQKGAQPVRHITARLKLLQTLVKEYKINNHDVPYHPVVEYTTDKLEHPNIEVRAIAVSMLVDIYAIVGEKLKGDLDGMKLANLEMLQKEFDGAAQRIGTSPTKGTVKLGTMGTSPARKAVGDEKGGREKEIKPGTSSGSEMKKLAKLEKLDTKEIRLGDGKKGENPQQPRQSVLDNVKVTGKK